MTETITAPPMPASEAGPAAVAQSAIPPLPKVGGGAELAEWRRVLRR